MISECNWSSWWKRRQWPRRDSPVPARYVYISCLFYLLRTNWLLIVLVCRFRSITLISLTFNINKFIVYLFFMHRLSPTWRMLTTQTPFLPCAKRSVCLIFVLFLLLLHGACSTKQHRVCGWEALVHIPSLLFAVCCFSSSPCLLIDGSYFFHRSRSWSVSCALPRLAKG